MISVDLKHLVYVAKICLSETVGTALLMTFSCLGTMDPNSSLVEKSFAVGFTVTSIIQGFGHISGAHINPSVTLAAMITGTLPLYLVPYYLLSQCVGAILGTAVFLQIIPSTFITSTVCVSLPGPGVSLIQAVLIEMIITSTLIVVCCASWDPKNALNTDGTSIKFGILVTMVKLTASPLTGANMNPTSALAPALLNNHWDYQWIYWIGPLTGALVTSSLYKLIYSQSNKEDIPK